MVSTIIGFSVIFVAVFCVFWGFSIMYKDAKQQKQWEEEKKKKLEDWKEPYEEYSKKYDKVLKIYQESKYYLTSNAIHYAIIDNKIHSMSFKPTLDLIVNYSYNLGKIPSEIEEKIYDLDKVKYYQLEGSVHKEQHITGGGGGGSSIKGAVVGSLVAGDVGAIVGSRKKVDEIQTTYKTIDDRKVILNFKDDTYIHLDYKFYEMLLDIMPEKDYDNYIANMKAKGKK